MANFMDSILVRKPGRSKFPLTHEWKSSLNMGRITPHLVTEVTPGDVFRVKSEIELKLSPLISPLMHRINLFQNYFYVPWFQVWSATEDFIGGGRDGKVECEPPYLDVSEIITICQAIGTTIYQEETHEDPPSQEDAAVLGFKNSWFDYTGLPLQMIKFGFDSEDEIRVRDNIKINMLPVLCCLKAYHDYFQDETLDEQFNNLEDLFNIRREDWISEADLTVRVHNLGLDEEVVLPLWCRLPRRGWEHDYFTSALPFAQRGDAVQVPIGGTAQVEIPEQAISLDITNLGLKNPMISYNGGPLPQGATHWEIIQGATASGNILVQPGDADNPKNLRILIQAFDDNQIGIGSGKWVNITEIFEDPDSQDAHALYGRLSDAIYGTANLENATAVSINTFRWLERLQMFLEKNARAGYRYFEQLLAHWHVIGDDKTLHRAEYLSGSVQPVKIGEVLQTSESTADSPQAEFAGYAAAYGNMNGFKRRFKYHGFVIGFISVLPRTNYMQGIPRMFLKNSRFDYLFPDFAHLGEQPVYNAELYYDPRREEGNALSTFGYMPRYSEYRTLPSTVHGDFQDELDFWHMAREFETQPGLNADFIYADPTKRIFAVTDESAKLWCQVLNKISVVRCLPKYGTPSL